MIVYAMPQQAPARAPSPPIPALPGQPGAPTAAQRAAEAATAADRAIADAERAAAEAERAAQQARENAGQPAEGPAIAGGQLPPPYSTSTNFPPIDPAQIIREAIPIVGMTLAMMVVLFIGWPLARAYARRSDKKLEQGMVRAQDLQPQIRQLQESLDTMAVELERISEAQRFQAKLMSERALPEGQRRG